MNRCHRCKVKSGIMPSGITAAFGQQTAAAQAKMSQGRSIRRNGKAKRARRAAPAGPVKRRNGSKRRAARRNGRARLVKGSAAAKRWGAKMRRLRKRR